MKERDERGRNRSGETAALATGLDRDPDVAAAGQNRVTAAGAPIDFYR